MATLITPNGKSTNVTPANNKFNYKELNKLVGGYIEIIRLNEDLVMVINEEGKLQNLPYNATATMYYQNYVSPYDCIVGNAVIMSNTEID